MTNVEGLDTHGRALLARLAEAPDDERCARQFDALYYELIWKYLRRRHAVMATRVAGYLGLPGSVTPEVLDAEVEEVVHDATKTALQRVRNNAATFDASKGSPTQWVIGAASFAYIEVAKAVVAARRSDELVFVDPSDLPDQTDPNPTTEEHVLRSIEDAEALTDAAAHVSEREFVAIRLRVTLGYSRGDAAQVIFGDSAMKTRKIVDGLVERGLAKLAAAWADRRSTSGLVGGINLSTRSDDKEEPDE